MKNYSTYKLNYLPLIISCVIFFISTSVVAQSKKHNNVQLSDTLTNFKVEQATEWTNLFYRTNGWFGGKSVV